MLKKDGMMQKIFLTLTVISLFFLVGCRSLDDLPPEPPMPGSSAKAGASPVGRAYITGEALPGGYSNPSRSGFTFLSADTSVDENGDLLLHISVPGDDRYDDTLTYFRLYYFSPADGTWKECLATTGTRRTRIDGSVSDWFETDAEAVCDISDELGDADYTDASWEGEITWVLGYQCVREGIMPWDCPNLWPVQRLRVCSAGMAANDDDSACLTSQVACVANEDCPDLGTCVNGLCQQEEPTACTVTSDCAVGSICQDQVCVVPECVEDADCQAGQTCQNNQCAAPPPECATNTDCTPPATCVANVCTTPVGTCNEVIDVGDDSTTGGQVGSTDATQVGGDFAPGSGLTIYNDRCLTPAGTTALTGDILDEYFCNADNTVGRTRYTCSCLTGSNGIAFCCAGSPEICDTVDNDCDSEVDEGGVCGPAGRCIEINDDGDDSAVGGTVRSTDTTQIGGVFNPTLTLTVYNDRCLTAAGTIAPTGGMLDEYFCNADNTVGRTRYTCSCLTGSDSLSLCCIDTGTEVCDGSDNDCDAVVDEGCDDDNDDYCDSGMTTVGTPATCSLGGGDCNDATRWMNPGRAEVCNNNADDNCDGAIDEETVCSCTDTDASAANPYTVGGRVARIGSSGNTETFDDSCFGDPLQLVEEVCVGTGSTNEDVDCSTVGAGFTCLVDADGRAYCG